MIKMFGRGTVLAVYLASVYYDIWNMIQTDFNRNLLAVALFIAFISGDSPWITYSKNVEVVKRE